jgi:hypothetical protein
MVRFFKVADHLHTGQVVLHLAIQMRVPIRVDRIDGFTAPLDGNGPGQHFDLIAEQG